MAVRRAKSYTGASLEFEKLLADGFICSVTVDGKRFELDPPVPIMAGQRVADLLSVDVLFMQPNAAWSSQVDSLQ